MMKQNELMERQSEHFYGLASHVLTADDTTFIYGTLQKSRYLKYTQDC